MVDYSLYAPAGAGIPATCGTVGTFGLRSIGG